MFPFSLYKKNNHGKFVLIFDIGSSSVGGALVELSENNRPRILYSVRRDIVFQSKLDFKKLTSSMLRCLREVVVDVRKNSLLNIDPDEVGENIFTNVSCFLSSPWNISQTKVLNFKKSQPFEISKGFIREVIKEEENNFKNSQVTRFSEKFEEMEVIKKGIMNIKIDGYSVDDPYFKKTKNAQVSFFVSLASKKVVDDIKGIISSSFSAEDIVFNSFSLSAFLGLRDLFNLEKDFMFIDIGGEVTDVSIIRDSLLAEIFSYPSGKNLLIREIEKEFKTTYNGAISLLNLYKENKSSDEVSLKMKEVVNTIKNRWLEYFRESLSDFSRDLFVPKTVFVTVDDDIADIFIDFLSDESLTDLTISNQIFNVISLKANTFDDFCNYNDKDYKDVFLSLGAVFSDKVFKEGDFLLL